MKVSVKADRCVGQGMCYLAAPDIFALSDEDGHAVVLQENVPSELEGAVRQAARSCPEEAVEIYD